MLPVIMVSFALLVVMTLGDVWRSALEDAGEQYATIDGMQQMLLWSANNLDSVLKVYTRNNNVNA